MSSSEGDVVSGHARRYMALFLGVMLAPAGAFLGMGQARALSPDVAVHTVPGCVPGMSITVRNPGPAAATSGRSLAAALGLPASSPLLARAASTHARWLSTITCKEKPNRTPYRPAAPSRTDADYASSNWSGYVTAPGAVSNPDNAEMTWTIPSVSYAPAASTGEQYSSIWPGLGGSNGESGTLVQDGTEQDAKCIASKSGGCEAYAYPVYFWFEIYPDEAELQVTNLSPAAGDSVGTAVSYLPSGAEFTMCDYTQQLCVSASQTPSSPPGNSAEWIVERPTVSGNLPPLPDFGTVQLASCDYQQGTTLYTARQGSGQSIDMYNGSDQLDSTSDLNSSGDGFAVTWHSAT